ncbi:uncharacterized protein RCC_04976 [Ramularia collo-cygni]|uniref:Uncharacterized protein n=1 Tax=Ramularia collo-cygni TaxID=112498 RepID=A0A2D3V0X1_9PEZI|nr:uncharacterized protein RCC_04976 [Ramularia collo-cygni]CZT19130.1 uncharacterized protein RCC_04976 [Ramularia collo-cygni]
MPVKSQSREVLKERLIKALKLYKDHMAVLEIEELSIQERGDEPSIQARQEELHDLISKHEKVVERLKNLKEEVSSDGWMSDFYLTQLVNMALAKAGELAVT